MANEKIYIVVPVYKVEAYLKRCVDSILNQTYTNWELVLVDDGSPDNCPALCDRYAAEHENITVIHQENGGLSAARNASINHAMKHGDPEKDWITFIDSDDFIHPNYLEYLYRAAVEAGTDLSSCGLLRTESTKIESAGTEILKYKTETPEDYWCGIGHTGVVPVAKLYRLRLFNGILYPAGKIHEDTFITHRLVFACEAVAVVDLRLYYWYVNPHSITASVWTPAQIDAMNAMEEQLAFFREGGFDRACKPTVKFLFWHSIKQLMKVHALSPKYDTYIGELKEKRSRAFRLHVQEFGLGSTLAYWFEIRILGPAKRILRKESLISFLKRKIKKKLHLR